MIDAARPPERSSAGFAAVAARWDVTKFGSWLRAGLDSWFHSSVSRGERSVSFYPLILDPDIDPVAPLVDAVQNVPGGTERLRDASAEALAVWTPESVRSGKVLDAFLRLAKRLPAAADIQALRRLLCGTHLNTQPNKASLRLQALETTLKLIALDDGEQLMRDLRRPEHWDTSFAATWLEGMARAGKVHWLDGVLDLRNDLEAIDPAGHTLQPLLRRLARQQGDAERVLNRLLTIELDSWLQRALFSGARAPLLLAERPDRINKGLPVVTLVIGSDEEPIYLDASERAGVLYEIYSREYLGGDPPQPRRDAKKPKSRKLAKIKQLLGEFGFGSAPAHDHPDVAYAR